jgi:hypothetical protein
MIEQGDTFATFVRRYRLERSEGLVLRYLADAWRVVADTVPPTAVSPVLADITDWLAAMLRATDATLLDEWELLARGEVTERAVPTAPAPAGPPAAWRTMVRTAAFGWVQMLAARNHAALAARTGWPVERLDEAMAPYWDDYDAIGIDGDARSSAYFTITEEPSRWLVTQRLADPEGDGEWRLTASVDLAAALADGAPTLTLESISPFSGVSTPESGSEA